MRYAVIFEKCATGAYVPDLPGCVAAAGTVDETRQLIPEAIELHLADMRATFNRSATEQYRRIR